MVTKTPTRMLQFQGREQRATSNHNSVWGNCYGQINAEDWASKWDAEVTSNCGDLKKLHSWVNRQIRRCTSLSSLLQYFENAPNKRKQVICMVHSYIFSFGGITFFTEFVYKIDFYTIECFPTNIVFTSCWGHINHPGHLSYFFYLSKDNLKFKWKCVSLIFQHFSVSLTSHSLFTGGLFSLRVL